MKVIRHMSTNIDGMLRNYKGRSMAGLINGDDGKTLSDKQARQLLAECRAKGWKLLPVSANCEGFDHYGGGCPGHLPQTQTPTTNEQ